MIKTSSDFLPFFCFDFRRRVPQAEAASEAVKAIGKDAGAGIPFRRVDPRNESKTIEETIFFGQVVELNVIWKLKPSFIV